MERRTPSPHLSWLLLPIAVYLVQSALSFPGRPYTGLALRGEVVASVDANSPAQRAGLAAGDQLRGRGPGGWSSGGPLAEASPGQPLTLTRLRGDAAQAVWLVPEAMPVGERRLNAALLVVASVFVLLGGWVWSERRDALTRAFFLLCVSFGCVLAPPPRWPQPGASQIANLALTAIAIFLPALFVHFFATFPESRPRGRRRAWVQGSYSIATGLFLVTMVVAAGEAARAFWVPAASEWVQVAAAIWFLAGMLSGGLLFVGSFFRAGSPDARRRLRVAFVGTLLGIAPFTTLFVLRNLSPGTVIPGERWAVALTLLVPASFAWAIVVHRVFDFRVALRVAAMAGVIAAACVGAYALGEWWTSAWGARQGVDLAGGALALVALIASLAGPTAPWLHTVGDRIMPGEEAPPLAVWVRERAGRRDAAGPTEAESLLADACSAVTRFLKLDGCVALLPEGGEVSVLRGSAAGSVAEPGPELRARAFRIADQGVQGIEDVWLGPQDVEALRLAGVAWLLPVGEPAPRAVLLLGRRLAGTWLSRREMLELGRFAQQLAIALENAELRREATSHGAFERELREAGRVQAHLLPQRVPVHPTLDCAAAVLSTEPVGGDYFDFVEGPDRSFTLAVGDVAGHGLPAALLLSHVQARFRSHAGGERTPAEILGLLNGELADFDQPEKFVGLVCARVDVRRCRIWIANAGLVPPLVRRRSGQVEEIDTGGLLLGVRRNMYYTDVSVELGEGDLLLVCTDGLPEAQRGQELYGMDRVKSILSDQGGRRAADVIEGLLHDVRDFADHPLDDLTAVVMRQLTQPLRRAGTES